MNKLQNRKQITQELNGDSSFDFHQERFKHLSHYWMKRSGTFDQQKFIPKLIFGKLEHNVVEVVQLNELESLIFDNIKLYLIEHGLPKIVMYNKLNGFWFVTNHNHLINVQTYNNGKVVYRTNNPTLFVVDSNEILGLQNGSYFNYCNSNQIQKGLDFVTDDII